MIVVPGIGTVVKKPTMGVEGWCRCRRPGAGHAIPFRERHARWNWQSFSWKRHDRLSMIFITVGDTQTAAPSQRAEHHHQRSDAERTTIEHCAGPFFGVERAGRRATDRWGDQGVCIESGRTVFHGFDALASLHRLGPRLVRKAACIRNDIVLHGGERQ